MTQESSSKQSILVGVLSGALVVALGASALLYYLYTNEEPPPPTYIPVQPGISTVNEPSPVTPSNEQPVENMPSTATNVENTMTLADNSPASVSQATVNISAAEIISWLTNNEKGQVNLSNITPIKLSGGAAGEDAYLASAEFPEQGNNFHAGYVLARPALKQAMILDGFGGFYNEIKNVGDYETGSFLIIGGGSFGQGYSGATLSVVKIDGWQVKTLHSAEESDNLGACGFDGKLCETEQVFFEPLESNGNKILITETTVISKGKDSEHLKSKTTSRILSFPIF
jgi:hypothetical protein